MNPETKETIARLFAHVRWADERVLDGLAGLDATPGPREALARPTELFAHVLAAEIVWLDRIEGGAPSVAVWPRTDLEGCRELAATARRRYAKLVDGLSPERLRESIAYRNSAGDAFESTVEEILLHVALHGAYHRGQIALDLRTSGLEPSPTDFIAFARGAPAATRTDAEVGGSGAAPGQSAPSDAGGTR